MKNKLKNLEDELIFESKKLCSPPISNRIYLEIEFRLENNIYLQVIRNINLLLQKDKKEINSI